ncbi:MAG: ferrochelatase [Acidobacteria bacterium]|nr:ferrochelatase [Acidobacteriota bacterium]
MSKRHIVLVTYGEPTRPHFVDQLVYSWRILVGLTRTVAPIPAPVVPLIALSRARGRSSSWTTEAYSSPLEPISERQAGVLRSLLGATDEGAPWVTHVAYEFRAPLLADVLGGIPSDDPVWIVPMYAADSAFTHALSRTVVTRVQPRRRGAVHVLPAIDVDPLAEVSAAHVLAHTPHEEGWRGADVAVVLAAHGTVIDPTEPIDTGLIATEQLCEAVAARLRPHFGQVVNGWLNHTRGGTWTSPPVEEALQHIADAGFRRVVYYPYGFLADNAESELEGRVALRALTNVESRHLPCLNESAALMRLIVTQVHHHAEPSRVSASVA